jgi:hypothetical protein
LGVLTTYLSGIVIPFAYEQIRSFSGSMKILYPMTVCNLCKHLPGTGKTPSCRGKKLPPHARHVYNTPEV